MQPPKQPARNKFPESLKAFRDSLGWTIEHCSEYFGVFYTTYCSWQNGKKKPSRKSTERIEAALKLSKTKKGREQLHRWREEYDAEKARRSGRPIK